MYGFLTDATFSFLFKFDFSTLNHNELTVFPYLGDVSSNITGLSL